MSVGVLLMAYGTPDTADDVEAYFTHIRGGRTPSADAVAHLRSRYEIVGGRTPLLDVTTRLRDEVEQELNARATGTDYRVHVGMKHWHPFISDVVPRMLEDGVAELVGIALAPHYSRLSVGAYRASLEQALADARAQLPVHFVESWHTHPQFLDLITSRLRTALESWPVDEQSRVVTVFSAHSLPERIRQWDDPYERHLLESCRAVASLAGINEWRFAWQSAGETGEPWLGPDIVATIEALGRDGVTNVLSVPIGFVSDHLEILYDIDHEARHVAEALGMTFRRVAMPNADPAFVRTIAAIARECAISS
ncbi:MAG: ferrochelatase [Gemmatimonadaceae bacterium]